MAQLLRQAQGLVAPCTGLVWIPQMPESQSRKAKARDPRVLPAVEGGQRMVLRLVARDSLLQRYTGTDNLSQPVRGIPCGIMRFEEQAVLVRPLREPQALLGQRQRGAQLAPGDVKRPQAPQHRKELWGIAQLCTQCSGTEVIL